MQRARRETERAMIELLSKRYAAPAWVLMPQIRNATGFAGNRTADAVAMSTWPSRGLHLYGFEIKVSRGDFLREIKKPEKAEPIASACHRFYVVTSGKEVAAPEELPPTWGLIEKRGGRLVQRKEAEHREIGPPEWLFFASLCRGVWTWWTEISGDVVPRAGIENELEAARQEGREEVRREVERKGRHAQGAHDVLKESVAAFEEKSGIKIERYGGRQLGEAVELVQNLQVGKHLDAAGYLAGILEGHAKTIAEAAAHLRENGSGP